MSKTIRAIIVALLVAGALTVARPVRAADYYTGWFYPNWWNPFVWCTWHYMDFGNGNYDYWDTCGGQSSYMDLRQ